MLGSDCRTLGAHEGRELLGLLHFGYTATRHGKEVLLIASNAALARNANIVDYWTYINQEAKAGESVILKMLDKELKSSLHDELLAFDRSKLRHV